MPPEEIDVGAAPEGIPAATLPEPTPATQPGADTSLETPPEEAPRLYADKFRTPEDMEVGYLEAQRAMHEANTKAAYYERVLQQQGAATQPQPAPEPEADPYRELDGLAYERSRRNYAMQIARDLRQDEILRAQATGEDPDFSKIASNAQAQADELALLEHQERVTQRKLDSDRRKAEQEAELRRRDLLAAPDAYATVLEPYLSVSGIPDVTAQELAVEFRRRGFTLSQLETTAPQTLAEFTRDMGDIVYARKVRANPRPVAVQPTRPQAVLPPRPGVTPVGGPRVDATPAQVPDAEVEAKFQHFRARFGRNVPDEAVRKMAEDAVAEDKRERAFFGR